MTNEEIKNLARKKLDEITLEIGNFVDAAQVIYEMGEILRPKIFKKLTD